VKYLKHFESYDRLGSGELPLQEISKEDFKDFLQTYCKQFLSVVKGIDFRQHNEWSGSKKLLYRKFKSNHGNYLLVNPKESKHRRISPWSDTNWHNLLISNLDSWKDYPRRNKSMISSGWSRALGHNGSDMYLVIPFDTTKIGVCSGSEFWESFNTWRNERDYINDWCRKLIYNLTKETGQHFVNDDNWEDLLPYLNRKYNTKFYGDYDKNKTLMDNLNISLDPKKNGFELDNFSKVSKLLEKNCRECWFEDESILVHWKYLVDLPTDQINDLFGI
jgi:hypothetical protein